MQAASAERPGKRPPGDVTVTAGLPLKGRLTGACLSSVLLARADRHPGFHCATRARAAQRRRHVLRELPTAGNPPLSRSFLPGAPLTSERRFMATRRPFSTSHTGADQVPRALGGAYEPARVRARESTGKMNGRYLRDTLVLGFLTDDIRCFQDYIVSLAVSCTRPGVALQPAELWPFLPGLLRRTPLRSEQQVAHFLRTSHQDAGELFRKLIDGVGGKWYRLFSSEEQVSARVSVGLVPFRAATLLTRSVSPPALLQTSS